MTEAPTRRRVLVATPTIPPSQAFRLAWLVVTVGVVAFRAVTTLRWSFFQDDWMMLINSSGDSLGHFMATTYNGHVYPGGAAFMWLATALDPLDYVPFAVLTCVLTGLMMLGWGLALRELFGERLHLVGVLVLIGFSPPTSTVALWWSGNIFFYPLEAATGFAVWFLARYLLRDGARRDQLGVLLSVAIGLFFWHKAVLITIPLAFLVLLVAPGAVPERIRLGVKALWPTALLVAAYLVVYVAVPWPEEGSFIVTFPQGRSPGQVADFAVTGLGNVAVPAVFGGPFAEISSPYGVYTYAAVWVRVVCLVLAVTGIILALAYRARAGWAVAMAGVYLGVSWGLVLFSSRFAETGVAVALEGRYVCDMLPVALLALLFVSTSLRKPTHDHLRRPLPDRGAVVVRVVRVGYLAVAASLALGVSVRNWDSTEPNSPEPWVSALLADAKDVGAADLYDSVTPTNTLNPIYYFGRANLSDILSPLDQDLRFNQPTQNGLLVAGEDGHLSEGEVTAPANKTVTPGPVANCGNLLEPGKTTVLALDGEIYEYEWVVQIDYFAPEEADVMVRTDNEQVDVTLEATPAGALGRLQYVVVDSVGRLEMTLARGTEPLCVTVVNIGSLAPTDRRPAPLRPLS